MDAERILREVLIWIQGKGAALDAERVAREASRKEEEGRRDRWRERSEALHKRAAELRLSEEQLALLGEYDSLLADVSHRRELLAYEQGALEVIVEITDLVTSMREEKPGGD